MLTRAALVVVAAAAAFLGTYAAGRADDDPAPVKRSKPAAAAVPGGAVVPGARPVPVPATANLPRPVSYTHLTLPTTPYV